MVFHQSVSQSVTIFSVASLIPSKFSHNIVIPEILCFVVFKNLHDKPYAILDTDKTVKH